MDSGFFATFFGTALGWFVAHLLTSKRDIKNEQRKIRVQLLLDAYRKLENASNREKTPWGDIESAIADIQLLGSLHEATLAMEFATAMSKSQAASLDSLLLALRNSLRSELELESISSEKVIFFRHIQK